MLSDNLMLKSKWFNLTVAQSSCHFQNNFIVLASFLDSLVLEHLSRMDELNGKVDISQKLTVTTLIFISSF